MPNEWLSPTLAQSEKLIKCYVEPNMNWKPGHSVSMEGLSLNRFQDIFTNLDAGAKRILVTGILILCILNISYRMIHFD